MKKKKTNIFSLMILFLLIFVSWSYAVETKKYPPYPDVWGYEFPWPQKDSRRSNIEVAKMPNGDYMVTYVKKWIITSNNSSSVRDLRGQFGGISFFSGESKDFTENEYNNFWNVNRDRKIKQNQIVLSDGSKIEPYSDYACGRCCPLFHFYIVKREKNGQIIDKKNLIYLLNNTLKIPINMYCEYNEGPSGLRRNYVLGKLVSINPTFVPLEDDNFMIIDMEGNIIIRFDKNLITKSDLLNKRLYVIERKVVDELREKLKRLNQYNDQTLTDAVYQNIIKLRKEGEK